MVTLVPSNAMIEGGSPELVSLVAFPSRAEFNAKGRDEPTTQCGRPVRAHMAGDWMLGGMGGCVITQILGSSVDQVWAWSTCPYQGFYWSG